MNGNPDNPWDMTPVGEALDKITSTLKTVGFLVSNFWWVGVGVWVYLKVRPKGKK